MADNLTTDDGVVGTDEIGGVHIQRVKPHWGADGSGTDVSVAAPMPVQASLESGQMVVGGVVVTPKFAAISAASSGNNTIVAAVSGKKIRVLSYKLMGDGAVTAKFQSGAGGTDLTGAFAIGANGGVGGDFCPVGFFETGSAALLNLSLGSAVGVRGHLTYIEV